MTIGHDPGMFEHIMTALFIGALMMFFVSAMRPVTHGQEMATEYTTNCDKVGGTMLVHKGLFGTTYECAAWMGK